MTRIFSFLLLLPALALGETTVNDAMLTTAPAVVVTDPAYGATGGDATDDTAAIQAALKAGAGGVVRIPYGTFMVNADGGITCNGGSPTGGLDIPSNTTVQIDGTLKALPNPDSSYNVLRITGSNITITGNGTIQGDRFEHVGSTGEWGFGIAICAGAKNVRVNGITLRDHWGDGLYVNGVGGARPTSILVDGAIIDNNRRQGISIVDVDGMIVQNSVISNTNGTAPQDGIDIEPAPSMGEVVKNVLIANNRIFGNVKYGVQVYNPTGESVTQVHVVGNQVYGNTGSGIGAFNLADSSIASNQMWGNGLHGLYLTGSTDVSVIGNTSIGNSQVTDNASSGFYTASSTRVSFQSNFSRGGSGTNQQKYGLEVQTCTDCTEGLNDYFSGGRTANRYWSTGNTGGHTFSFDTVANDVRVLPTWGATVAIDATVRANVVVASTNAAATIAAPTGLGTNNTGKVFLVRVSNQSGGALGTITWDPIYKMSAWTNPANANSRTVWFNWNGAACVEVARTPSDVPN